MIADLLYKQASHTLQKQSNLACPKSTIVVDHYTPTEDRKVQTTGQRIEYLKHSQPLAKDWKHKVNIIES